MNDRLHAIRTELDAFRIHREGSQPDLFSQIAAVAENAGTVWTLECLEAIRQVALRHSEFTVEDLDGLLPPTYDLRAVGGVMLEAARRGWIRKLGWVGSGAKRHGRPLRLWASLIYEGQCFTRWDSATASTEKTSTGASTSMLDRVPAVIAQETNEGGSDAA